MIDRIEKISKYSLGFKYFWVDAGWYGESNQPCPNEHIGDWHMHTGNWVVNKNYHPDGLLEVAKSAKDAELKFLLWIEPERVHKNTPLPQEHPEWFLE